MNQDECPKHENVLRALTTPHWDLDSNRTSSSLFRGPNISVSRLAILPVTDLFQIFINDLHRPPASSVIGAGEINVGILQDIGTQHATPLNITVMISPLPNNPAHAEIPQKISRSLAIKIIRLLKIYPAPNQASAAK